MLVPMSLFCTSPRPGLLLRLPILYTMYIMVTVTVSQARGAISHLVDRVLEGEEVMLTRYGRPVAVLVRPDRLASRRDADSLDPSVVIDYALSQGKKAHLTDLAGLSVERAEALVAGVRASRARR